MKCAYHYIIQVTRLAANRYDLSIISVMSQYTPQFTVNQIDIKDVNPSAVSQRMTQVYLSFLLYSSPVFQQGYRYHKLRKAFSKFYRRHFELIEKRHVSLKKLMQQGICNPELYGDLVKNLRKSLEIQTSLIFLNV